jgi:Predicted xylanase/chitin deacetylase
MKQAILAAAVLLAGQASAQEPVSIAVTFDDLPVHGVLPAGMSRVQIAQQVIDGLKAGGVPPTYGLVNGVGTANEPDSAPVLSLWRESGNLLGNHTWSHPGLSKAGVEAFEADTLKNEPLLAQYAGGSNWHVFRYPFVDEGKDEAQKAEVRSFLAVHGYKIADVTVAISDWDYPGPYAQCLAKNDTAAIAKLEGLYLNGAKDNLERARALSRAAYGRDIPYILLLHIGSFQAHMLPKLLELYRGEGARFVSLDDALKDPAYAGAQNPALPAAPRQEELAKANGKAVPPPLASTTAEVQAMCQ